MKRRDILITVLMLVALSNALFAALARDEGLWWSLEDEKRVMVFGLSAPLVSGRVTFTQASEASNRTQIYDLITAKPGVHFREICRLLKMPVGVVQYHLGVLSSTGLVLSRRDKRYRRFFASGVYSSREVEVISALRQDTARLIVSMLLERSGIRHGELASELGLTSQAVTWQMKGLKALGLVEEEDESTIKSYTLNPCVLQTVSRCMDAL